MQVHHDNNIRVPNHVYHHRYRHCDHHHRPLVVVVVVVVVLNHIATWFVV
jgi:hypothetical protein